MLKDGNGKKEDNNSLFHYSGNNLNDIDVYTLISLENYEFYWDDEKHQTALSNIDFSFNNGEITVILGDTGSGKSALLSCILGNIYI